MTSQNSQAMNPEKRNLPTLATAANREIVAMLPLSTYLNGSCRSRPAARAAITLAACLPDCIATCATPGTPASIMSPMTKTSGNPGSEQSSSTGTRPARSTCRPAWLARCLASGEDATPAAHTLVRLAMRRLLPSLSLTSMPYSSMSTTTAPSCISTPSCSSFLVALAARCSPNVPSTVGDPLFEADQVEQVDDQPEQPGDEPGEPEPADAGYGGEPRDRRHAPLVDILEGFG